MLTKMSDKSDDLLLFLRQNKAINCSTIESLINCGFDSNDSLMALNFDSDLPQMTDISWDQKFILKEVINEYKSKDDMNHISCNNNNNNKILLIGIKDLINENNSFIDEVMKGKNEELEKQLTQQKFVINQYQNESKSKDSVIKKLKEELKQLKQINEKLVNKDKNLNEENVELIEKSGKTSTFSPPKRYVSKSKSLAKYESKKDPIIKQFAKEIRKRSYRLKQSIKRPLLINQYKCTTNQCNQSFNGLDLMRKHIRLSHKKMKESKQINNNSENTKQTKLRIKKIDAKDKQFVCNDKECNKKFANECLLKIHMRRHSTNKPFECQYKTCDKRFLTPQEARKHYDSRHLSVKPFKCEFNNCGKSFGVRDHLNTHIKGVHYKVSAKSKKRSIHP